MEQYFILLQFVFNIMSYLYYVHLCRHVYCSIYTHTCNYLSIKCMLRHVYMLNV